MGNMLLPSNIEEFYKMLEMYKEDIRYRIYDIDICAIPIETIRNSSLEFIARYSECSQLYLAKSISTPKHIFRIIINTNKVDLKRIMAQNPNTPHDILKKLSMDTDTLIRLYVADNPNTPTDVIKILARDNNSDIKNAASKRSNWSMFGLMGLTKPSAEKDFTHLIHKASNNGTSIEDLSILSQNSHAYIRQKVASNSKCSSELLERLMHDPDADVRFAVLNNPRVSHKIIQVLMNDENDKIKRLAMQKNTDIQPPGFWSFFKRRIK